MNFLKKNIFKNKEILVTGGCGSIGSEIVRQLIKHKPKLIKIFDNDEAKMFEIQQELNNFKKARYLIGDIRDETRLKVAMKNTNIVFHCAALKHVPLCEYNPYEAVKTNVIGTQNVIKISREEEIDKVVFISTDKAVNPINTMGATKLLSEKLIINDIGSYKTKFCCVRFGNVLNSSGSVIPTFINQIKKGKPITITSTDMTRFFMSIKEATNLVLRAAEISKGREIFILKMKSLRIIDLAKAVINNMNISSENNRSRIKITGVRPGEKLHEILLTQEESRNVKNLKDMFVLYPGHFNPHEIEKGFESKNQKTEYDSRSSKHLTILEIMRMIKPYTNE